MEASSSAQPLHDELQLTPKTIQVFIRSLLNRTVTLDVFVSDTTDEIKDRLSLKTTVPSSLFHLAFEGKILKGHATLRDYNVGQQSTLHAVLIRHAREPQLPCAFPSGGIVHFLSRASKDPSSPEFAQTIELLFLTGTILKLTVLTVPLSATILDVKQLISVRLGIPSVNQRLIYRGSELSNDAYLLCWEVVNGSKIYLVQRLERSTKSTLDSVTDVPVSTELATKSSAEPGESPIIEDDLGSIIPWRTFAESIEGLERIDKCFNLSEKELDRNTTNSDDTRTVTTFVSAKSRASNAAREVIPVSHYSQVIEARNLVPKLDDENNWSGRGQHVEFERSEAVPLELSGVLGHSATALVQEVRCRRIKLARKSISLDRNMTLEEALNEVVHLQNLRHSHIVRLVGTYLQGQTFAILMYPAAEWNLKAFLHDPSISDIRTHVLPGFFSCLAHAVAYIHSCTTRHMDIKPPNILVKKHSERFRVYLADFDVAMNFRHEGHSQTDTPRKRTPLYCAPEVYFSKPKGRASDIFSLGCVFAEMFTVMAGLSLDEFSEVRFDGNTRAFHATLPKVHQHMASVFDLLMKQKQFPAHWTLPESELDHCQSPWLRKSAVVAAMLSESPEGRPLASTVSDSFAPVGTCCRLRSVDYTVDESVGD